MDFSKDFRTLWWGILIIAIGSYLYLRFEKLIIGESVTTDVIVFLVWVALCLGPLFKEIELPGIKLKSEIKELKENVEKEFATLRNDLRITTDVRSNVSPNFWFGAPPSDSKLPGIEEKIKKVIEETFTSYGFSNEERGTAELNVSPDIMFLFQARHNIEKELRYLVVPFEEQEDNRRFLSLPKMLNYLTRNEVISHNLAGAIKEIYSVCSPAIHGEPVSMAKISFVKDTAPDTIAALRAISRRNA